RASGRPIRQEQLAGRSAAMMTGTCRIIREAFPFRRTSMPAHPLAEVAVWLRPEDNVAVAARPLPAGTQVEIAGQTLTISGRVGLGNKFALRPTAAGAAVLKYGQVIGFAGRAIAPGEHVHVHNVRADAFERDYAFGRDRPPAPPPPAEV